MYVHSATQVTVTASAENVNIPITVYVFNTFESGVFRILI